MTQLRSNVTPVGIASAAGASALATAFGAMSANTWTTFSMPTLTAAMVNAGGGAGASIFGYTCKAKYDAAHKKIRYVGHSHGSGTPQGGGKVLDYDEDQNLWSINAAGAPFDYSSQGGHNYYHLAMDLATGDIYVHGNNGGVTRKLPYGSTTWSTMSGQNPVEGLGEITYGLEHLAGANLVFFQKARIQTSDSGVTAWTNRLTLGVSPWLMGGYHCWSAVTDTAAYGGGGNGNNQGNGLQAYKVTTAGVASQIADTPITCGVSQALVTAHPNGTDLLLIPGSGETMRRYNAVANTYTTLSASPLVSGSTLRVVCTMKAYGGIIVFDQSGDSANPVCRLYKA